MEFPGEARTGKTEAFQRLMYVFERATVAHRAGEESPRAKSHSGRLSACRPWDGFITQGKGQVPDIGLF